MKISVIIPVLNEVDNICKLLRHIREHGGAENIREVIVVDAGSTDGTITRAWEEGAKVLHSAVQQRAWQMNYGAGQASGDILHFVHADALPPEGFANDVIDAVSSGYQAGSFRSLFNTSRRFLRFNSYFSRFNGMIFRGGGQTLFITRTFFHRLGGYDTEFDFMEEYDLIRRIARQTPFKVIQKDTLVSVRDYDKHGHIKLQCKYALMLVMFALGAPRAHILKVYLLLM